MSHHGRAHRRRVNHEAYKINRREVAMEQIRRRFDAGGDRAEKLSATELEMIGLTSLAAAKRPAVAHPALVEDDPATIKMRRGLYNDSNLG